MGTTHRYIYAKGLKEEAVMKAVNYLRSRGEESVRIGAHALQMQIPHRMNEMSAKQLVRKAVDFNSHIDFEIGSMSRALT